VPTPGRRPSITHAQEALPMKVRIFTLAATATALLAALGGTVYGR
jgi:hypothetical protein